MGKRHAPGSKSGLVAVAVAGAALLALAGGFLFALGGPAPPGAAPGGHWTLTRGDGAQVTDRDFRGRYVLLYFGYTSCPDLCPTTLTAVSEALRLLGARGAQVQPVFVTVDPAHDTASVVGRYASLFDARLIGLTGTRAELARIEREYRIVVRPRRMEDGTRVIDHTAVLVLIGPDGRPVAPLPAEENAREIAERLARLLS